MTVAEYLADFLRSAGVNRVFGVPGGEIVPVIEAFRRAGLDYVLVHHEAAAGFAADVTGQLSDRPGVCMATVGPGAVNLLSTAISATLERSPVLAITADIDLDLAPRVSHMSVDLSALFEAGTKGSFRLSPETLHADLRCAWQLALKQPRGAVHLAISPEVALSEVAQERDQYGDHADLEPVSSGSGVLDAIVTRVRTARHPFILAGLGLEQSRSQAALQALAERWQVPVAVTPKAKGHFPENHPLFAGCLSAYGDQPLQRALAEADLIVGIGLDGVDLVTSVWDIKTPLISLSPVLSDDPVFRPLFSMDGDLDGTLALLHSARAQDPTGTGRAEKLRTEIASRLATPYSDSPGTIRLHDLISALRTVFPPEGVVTLDVGAFKLLFLQEWRTDYPKTLFVANGLSAMGYALPAALAVSLEQNRKPLVAIVGDGALLMYAGEMATIARSGRPIVILVIVDQALALIRLKQLRQKVAIHGTEFGVTDYRALASAFGLSYSLVDRAQDAPETLAEALKMDRPILIEARVNKQEYVHFR